MKVTFDWKNFQNEKPVENKKIIFKNNINKGELIIGEYTKIGDTHYVSGGKLNLISLSKKNVQTYAFPESCEVNEWDYYTEAWV